MQNIDTSFHKYSALKQTLPNTKILLATKGISSDFLLQFIALTGHKYYAENYASELSKWDEVLKKYPETEISFIGSFQSGNIKKILKYCNSIESFSSLKMLEKVRNEANKLQKNITAFAQINIGIEPQKNGFLPSEINAETIQHFSGIMCIPPFNKSPNVYFNQMQKIAQKHNIKHLSMGMSSDLKQRWKTVQRRLE